MNERIRQLAEQAGPNTEEELNDDRTNIYVIDVEKFAELIVRECVDVIVRNEHATLNIDNFTNEKAQGIQLGLEFATIDIAEHFGVEE